MFLWWGLPDEFAIWVEDEEKFPFVRAILPTKATNRMKTRGIIKMLPMRNRTRGDVLAI